MSPSATPTKQRWMSPSATPATQSTAASPATNRAQARHQSQSSAASATSARQNEGRCHQAPRLPRETKVDVTKRHTCHAKYRVDSRCHQVPRNMVRDKVVCERWCVTRMVYGRRWVTNLCARKIRKDGVWQSCVWKKVSDKDGVWKMVWQWCATVTVWQWCVRWRRTFCIMCQRVSLTSKLKSIKDVGAAKARWCVTKMFCDKVVCVTKLFVKDGV